MKSKYTRKNIIALPDPRLRQRSAKVHVITDKTLQIVDNMIAATLDWEKTRPHEIATALSAVQIGELERIVIIREDFDDRNNKNFVVLINPEITKLEGKVSSDTEGCLSVADIYAEVPRHEKVRIKAIGLDGREIRLKSPSPFMARLLQHEIDHTNGIPFIDRVTNRDGFSVLDKNGELKPIKYEKVQKMGIVKDD